MSKPSFKHLRRDTVMKPDPLKTWVGVLCTMACGLVLALETQVSAAMIPSSAEPEADKSRSVAAELAKFQGTWQLIASETNGKKMAEEQVKQFRVKIEKDHHTVTFGDQVVAHEVKFTVDPTTQPKSSEDTLEDGPNKGKKIRGIYVLEGDSLTSCVGAIDAPRPTEFSAKPGSGHSLRRFQRVKTVEAAAKPGDAEATNAKEYRAFEGTWRFVAIQVGGRDLPAEGFKTSRLIFKGHDFTTINDGGTSRGAFLVDATKTPKTMDITISQGAAKGVTFQGIYELKGDTYKICGSPTGKDRPKEFDSKPGSGYIIQVLEREKP
jgi:uncharacterized protein (TIGR03067 family)